MWMLTSSHRQFKDVEDFYVLCVCELDAFSDFCKRKNMQVTFPISLIVTPNGWTCSFWAKKVGCIMSLKKDFFYSHIMHTYKRIFPAFLIHCDCLVPTQTQTHTIHPDMASSQSLHAMQRSCVQCVCARACSTYVYAMGFPCLSTVPVLSAFPIQSIS